MQDQKLKVSIIGDASKLTTALNTASGKLQFQILSAFAEFERNIIRKRQAEGIAKAKLRGVYENRKRKRKVSDKRITDLKQEGLNNTEIAEYLGVTRMTVYRALKRVA